MMSVRTRHTSLFVVASLVVAINVTVANAAEPDQPERRVQRYGILNGTPLRTQPPGPPPRLPVPPPTPPADAVAPTVATRDRDVLIVHGRWLTVPNVALELLYDHHQPLSQPSFGLAWETGPSDGRVLAFELAWLPLIPRSGNWLARGADPTQATYVESRMHMLAFDVTYRRQWEIGQIFRFQLGAGLGVAALIGNIHTDDVLPDCVEPVATCGHWPTASRSTVDLPTRIVPVLHVTAGMELDLGDTVVLRLSGGLKNVLYLGAGLGVRL